ncbi:dockerin type I domain-containing protein [Ruminococcus flavefaciens]|uniref:dockerin type I domain-containing protein n=1 Tax=Ruminococcus flavefaciens TaxID=1265 RepID=UPI0026ED4061|nr:dockerin type I domain-containing protein [Ruminococcus flavefaciens]
MKKTLGKFIRKTVAGISALAITASSYAAANALTYVKLPVANAADEKSPLIGDVNEDNKIDINDIITLSRYFYNSTAYPLSQQGRINAAMAYYAGSDDTPDEDDLQAITEYLGGNIPVLGDSSIRISSDIYENVPGDADCDGDVDFSDLKAINNYLFNPTAYPLTDQGRRNAAMSYYAGNDNAPDEDDVQALIEYLAGNISKLCDPNIRLTDCAPEDFPGDADCDGDVDFSDLKAINNYLFNPTAYPLTDQGRRNAAMSYYAGNDNAPDEDDVQALIEYLAGNISKLCDPNIRLTDCAPEDFPGDADCDGDVDFSDLKAINNYLFNPTAYPLTDQGRRNAAMSYYAGNDNAPDEDDVQALIEYLAGNISKLYDQNVRLTDCAAKPVPGDADCDGDVDYEDIFKLSNYLYNPTAYPMTDQGRCNAAMSYYAGNDNAPDEEDLQAMVEYLAGTVDSLYNPHTVLKLSFKNISFDNSSVVYGDFNCDNEVDIVDSAEIINFINGGTVSAGEAKSEADFYQNVKISVSGLRNADAYNPGFGLDRDDADAVTAHLSGAELPVVKKTFENKPGDFELTPKS